MIEAADMILTVANVIITGASLHGAWKSQEYYNKSKTLAAHTNINKALVEIEKMLNKLPEALTATSKNRQNPRGTNLPRIICDIGNELIGSYNVIRSCTPSEYTSALFGLENEGTFELRKYINGYISGEAIKDNALSPYDYAVCQKCLMAMQDYLKHKLDEIGEKLK